MKANMIHTVWMRWCAGLAIPLAAMLIGAPSAIGAEDSPGFIDAKPFTDLVDDEAILVEVNISPALLRMIAAGIRESDPDLTETIEGLRGIRALVIDLSTVPADSGVEKMFKDTVRNVERDGWERLAVVRDESSLLHVMVKGGDDDRVRGLLVLILEKEPSQLVFVNLHGLVDIAKLQALSEEMDLPGLDQVPVPEQD